jgi:hypothetical protein
MIVPTTTPPLIDAPSVGREQPFGAQPPDPGRRPGNTVDAFLGLLRGENVGKMIVSPGE